MRTIVGLGNPGAEYDGTRHNAGFILVDHLAARWGFPPFRRDGSARSTHGAVDGVAVQLLKPQTYMNRSGAALARLKSDPAFEHARDLLVVVDETALPIGRFRLRAKGSAGGHNGLKSIEGALRSQDYARLRIGVGPVPPDYEDLADFVLDGFSREEADILRALLDPMADAATSWATDGIELAMTRYNRNTGTAEP